jgi:hypothetical protein
MLQFQPQARYALPSLIKTFRELPDLLTQANSLGTGTIYLVDWFEGDWTFKGDYIPRSDLGGAAALREGIAALHRAGGRVILYVEGWIVDERTAIGKQHGAEWSVVTARGPIAQYPGYWKMCPGAGGWLAYLETVARRIGGYGADGIFLDSQGWRSEEWKCVVRAHGHPVDDPQVFNEGCIQLARRVRAALRVTCPEAILLTEQSTLQRQFEYKDGALEGGIQALVAGWLWDAQGMTDTYTTSVSLDGWNQILALGAKLCCPAQFFETPPGASASSFLSTMLQKKVPDRSEALTGIAQAASFGLNQWRNAGLILGKRMPGFEGLISAKHRDGASLRQALEALRQRCAALDASLAGTTAPPPTAYLKAVLKARQAVARVIDDGSSVAVVNSGSPTAAAWRFANAKGIALTAVNVADTPHTVAFANAPGVWRDGVSGEDFAARSASLTVPVPAHGLRMLHKG